MQEQIKLAMTCNKNEKQDPKNSAELNTGSDMFYKIILSISGAKL
jgi:hypothetical protein